MTVVETDPQPPERTRLHISPFNAELLDRVLPAATRPLARDISFHSVQTFPERGFGYVDLPTVEAEKVKKKLHGSTLKGAKVRVEEARPESRKRKSEEGDEEAQGKVGKKRRKRVGMRREDGVLPGHELEDGRRVKRGWTGNGDVEEVAKRRQGKSESCEDGVPSEIQGRKLRFKAKVPPNMTTVPTKSKSKTKEVKSPKDRGKRKGKPAVVEEFSMSKKIMGRAPAAGSATQKAVRYEDDRGWVDDAGNVVEAARPSKSRGRNWADRSKNSTTRELDAPNNNTAGLSQLGDREESRIPALSTNEGIESEISSSSEEESEDISSSENSGDGNGNSDKTKETGPDNTPRRPSEGPVMDKEVHPLEALFKRPVTKSDDTSKPRLTPIETSFSFFNPEGEEVVEEEGTAIALPQTPHTKGDLEGRTVRSAAPTPDTAAISKRFDFPFSPSGDSDDVEHESGESESMVRELGADEDAKSTPKQDAPEESAFRKWFYENRGELNRGWKRRRREGRKLKRQRENRKLDGKIA